MVSENEGQSLREYGNRKKRLKRRRRAVIIVLILLFFIAGGLYILNLYNRNYNSCSVMKTMDVTGENALGYLSYGSSVVKYSKNGAEEIDKDGKLLWNGSFELSDPIADTCGKYVVIAGKDSKEIHIFDNKGLVHNILSDYDIMKVEIASQGVVAALSEEGDENHIILYDVDGTVLVDKKTSVSNEGYPMDISLSDNGKKLVTSYLSYAGGKLVDIVTFYNFGEVGQNHTEGWVGSENFDEGVIVPRVAFINNDTVCAFSDNGFAIYSMKEIPDEIIKQDVEGQIQSVFYSKEYFGVALQAEGTSSKHVVLYDLKGKKLLDKAIDYDYEKIYLTSEEIILYDNMSCVIMKLNGKIKFRYTFDSNIEAIYPINNLDRYFVAGENKLTEILLEE